MNELLTSFYLKNCRSTFRAWNLIWSWLKHSSGRLSALRSYGKLSSTQTWWSRLRLCSKGLTRGVWSWSTFSRWAPDAAPPLQHTPYCTADPSGKTPSFLRFASYDLGGVSDSASRVACAPGVSCPHLGKGCALLWVQLDEYQFQTGHDGIWGLDSWTERLLTFAIHYWKRLHMIKKRFSDFK